MIMKKNIFKLFSVMVVSATVLTGCIEEVFPEDSTATSDQIGASAKEKIIFLARYGGKFPTYFK